MTQYPQLAYQIAVTQLAGVGSVIAKKLIAYTGSVEAIFKEKKQALLKIPGIGDVLADEIANQKVFPIVEKELAFIEKYNIETHFYLDSNYPQRLKSCDDCPVLLYSKGKTDFNAPKMLAIVGTRNATNYGKEVIEKIVSDLSQRYSVTIVSGLAYGVDIAAHRASLKSNLPTIAALAHGLHTIYPPSHTNYAKNIVEQGALLTEFTSSESPERAFFVRRNRIVAGMCDATLVVESSDKGGALITAELALSYNRELLAIPGRTNDLASKGCNKLIKTNKASMVECADDIEFLMHWEPKTNKTPVQKQLFLNISEEEQKIVDVLKAENELAIDIICSRALLPVSKVSPLLLNLEFSDIVKSLPGKVYRLL